MTIVIKINNKKKRKSKPIVLHLQRSKKNRRIKWMKVLKKKKIVCAK